jgi:hypothetical protein
MKPKDTDKINHSKYRPITCLPTLYKIPTACIGHQIYLHCENNNIIAEEQKGCRKLSQGCKEQLLIDSTVTEQAKHQKRYLNTAYIDYTKAFDSVPHAWLLRVLALYKMNQTLMKFLSCVMKKCKTTLHLSINNSNIITQTISIKRGIYQGESLIPLWFCLALNPLFSVLNKTGYGYNITGQGNWMCVITYRLQRTFRI